MSSADLAAGDEPLIPLLLFRPSSIELIPAPLGTRAMALAEVVHIENGPIVQIRYNRQQPPPTLPALLIRKMPHQNSI